MHKYYSIYINVFIYDCLINNNKIKSTAFNERDKINILFIVFSLLLFEIILIEILVIMIIAI